MSVSNQDHEIMESHQKNSHSADQYLKTPEEGQVNYYHQFCRLYLTNVILTTQLKELSGQKTQLLTKLNRLQKRAEELSEGNSGQIDEKKRRIRRAASQIARHYKCQVEGCSKSYGSEGSLNQHIKIKHPELFRAIGNLDNDVVEQSNEDEDQSM